MRFIFIEGLLVLGIGILGQKGNKGIIWGDEVGKQEYFLYQMTFFVLKAFLLQIV